MVEPIVGVRYLQAFGDQYDVCEKCEAEKEHDVYPYFKIKTVEQGAKVLEYLKGQNKA